MQNKASQVWKNLNKTGQLLLIFLGVLAAGSFYRGCAKEGEIDNWRAQYEEFRSKADSTSLIADSLRNIADNALVAANEADSIARVKTVQIDMQQRRISDLQEQITVTEIQNDSVFEELAGKKDVEAVVRESPKEAELWIRFSFNLRAENALLKNQIKLFVKQTVNFEELSGFQLSEISNLRVSLTNQTARADSLQSVMWSIPPAPPKERFLGIFPLPSRQTSFYIGAIAGVVSYLVLDNFLAGGK